MHKLVALNASGQLRSTRSYKGFCVEGRRVPGLAACLHRCSHYRITDRTRTLSLFAPGQGSGMRLLRSNTHAGVSIHDKIRKSLQNKTGPPRPRNFVSACANAAHRFCTVNALSYEAGELVIADPLLPVATRFDAIMKRSDGSRELISWKTGCGPRNSAELLQHKTQLAMERRMLEIGHDVPIDYATLLYVGALQNINTRALRPVFHGFELGTVECSLLAQAAEKHLAKTVRSRQRRPRAK